MKHHSGENRARTSYSVQYDVRLVALDILNRSFLYREGCEAYKFKVIRRSRC